MMQMMLMMLSLLLMMMTIRRIILFQSLPLSSPGENDYNDHGDGYNDDDYDDNYHFPDASTHPHDVPDGLREPGDMHGGTDGVSERKNDPYGAAKFWYETARDKVVSTAYEGNVIELEFRSEIFRDLEIPATWGIGSKD
ncbi:hypothetical protein DPMN_013775 [Dreissena polymorpha]|uniref:Uncharacterized protein n=1 Tax=Dreissena polymorpha TaxID=45954 RepID=A0A9D4N4T7_DREPO|nr:hypothetical protein DPMN_013775 [Dreissena polymorpha]